MCSDTLPAQVGIGSHGGGKVKEFKGLGVEELGQNAVGDE